MASTLAGNFTILRLGRQPHRRRARPPGRMSRSAFWTYFRLGAPVTVITIAIGAMWLA